MERELTVRHVFVGFVKGRESGIRNAEFAILSMSPVGGNILYSFILSLLAETQFALQQLFHL